MGYANPFLPERVAAERAVLGEEFIEGEPVWSYRAEHPEPRANVWRIVAKLETVVNQLAGRLSAGVPVREEDLALYEDAALQLLYQRCYPKFYEAGFGSEQANPEDRPIRSMRKVPLKRLAWRYSSRRWCLNMECEVEGVEDPALS